MSSTDYKMSVLQREYPEACKDTLLELLVCCGGSVKDTRKLLDEGSGVLRRKRTATYYQAPITSLLAGSEKRVEVGESKGGKVTLYGEEDVARHLSPFVVFKKAFFPPELADRLLVYLEGKKHVFNAKRFYLFDTLCESSQLLAFFCRDKREDLLGLTYNGKEAKVNFYEKDLEDAARLVEKYVNEDLIAARARLPFESRLYWNCDTCLINYYETCANRLDWHSDRLSHIGPHNYIASVSLGATREFRVRRNHGDSRIYSIIVPHNSMVVMTPGCQEEFKHCVNARKTPIQVNNISNAARYNLTFRYYPPDFIDKLPNCSCGLSMCLRRSYKNIKTRGKYFWSCENAYQNKDCGDFYWANFKNTDRNLTTDNQDSASRWIAEDDEEASHNSKTSLSLKPHEL